MVIISKFQSLQVMDSRAAATPLPTLTIARSRHCPLTSLRSDNLVTCCHFAMPAGMGMNATMKKSTAIFAISCLLLATGIGASALLFAPDAPKTNVVSSGTALVGGAFEATNQDGKRVSEKDFRGKYTLFYFGYTFCPDVCPAELQVISAALSEIDGARDKFNLVFVTIDPARDTPEIMKDYVAHFWPGTVGLSGSADDIRKIASAYRVYYARPNEAEADKDSYLMDHSSIVYLMGPDGRFVRHFPYGTTVDDMRKALLEVINN